MKKRKVMVGALIAALVMMGCSQEQQIDKGQIDKGKQAEPDIHKGGGSAEAYKGVRVVFEGEAAKGRVQISIDEGAATVWYTEGTVVYLGKGALDGQGAVSIELKAVQDGRKRAPFAGRYDKKAKTFTIVKLTEGYLKAAETLTAKVKGVSDEPGKSFVRHVKGVIAGDDGAVLKDVVTTFIIAVDGQDMTATGFYSAEGSGEFRSASGTGVIKGDEGRAVVVFSGVRYEAVAQFKKDAKGAVTLSSFEVKRYNDGMQVRQLLDNGLVVQKKGLQLCGVDGKVLGSLDIIIRGSQAQMTVRQADRKSARDPSVVADLGGEEGAWQTKVVLLEKAGEGVYQSAPLKDAYWKTDDSTPKHYVRVNEQSVFAFYNKDDSGSKLYNTYDIRITGYDPATKRFYLSGRYNTAQKIDPDASSNKAYGACALLGDEPHGDVLYVTAGGAAERLARAVPGFEVIGE